MGTPFLVQITQLDNEKGPHFGLANPGIEPLLTLCKNQACFLITQVFSGFLDNTLFKLYIKACEE